MDSSCCFLSERVRFLICGLNEDFLKKQDANPPSSGNVTDDIYPDFAVLQNDGNSIDFVQSVKKLLPTCHVIHNHFKQLTTEEFSGKYRMDLDWTNYYERIVECFTMFQSNDSVDHILSFLLLFPILERCLGDLYLSVTGSKLCPTNLKELLVAKEIQDVIGQDVTMVMYIMAGPPQGLNLRNVVWHGFVAENEIPNQYGSCLIYLIIQIGKRLTNTAIKQRPMISLPDLGPLAEVFSQIDTDSAVSEALSHQQYFIPPTMKRIWEKAVLFCKEGKSGFAIVLMLPLLEHLLRMGFAWANQCPERILTAESTTLFTTFDEILSPSLPSGSDNQLRIKMGDQYIEMLMDMLVHSEGPRLRDHLSHGELGLDSIPHGLCHHILCICLAFSSQLENMFTLEVKKLDPRRTLSNLQLLETCNEKLPFVELVGHNHQIQQQQQQPGLQWVHSCTGDAEKSLHYESGSCSKNTETSNTETVLLQIVKTAQNYQSVYHPFAVLKREICSSSQLLDTMNNVSVPDEFLTQEKSELASTSQQEIKIIQKALDCLNCSKALPKNVTAVYNDDNFSKQLLHLLIDGPVQLKTLYRPRRELEVAALLRGFVQHCCAMTTQVLDMANLRLHQYHNKQLRSRQRNNYKRLTIILPFYQCVGKVALLMVAVELSTLQTIELGPEYIRFLKRCLQCSENMESLTSSAKNRWDECKTVCEQLLENISDHYSHDKQATKDTVFELSEVKKHCSEDDVWIIINGKVYDVTSYVTSHPGGHAILRNAGGNATDGFLSEKSHGIVKSHIENLLKKFYIGKVKLK